MASEQHVAIQVIATAQGSYCIVDSYVQLYS